jgi:hypothetical protein
VNSGTAAAEGDCRGSAARWDGGRLRGIVVLQNEPTASAGTAGAGARWKDLRLSPTLALNCKNDFSPRSPHPQPAVGPAESVLAEAGDEVQQRLAEGFGTPSGHEAVGGGRPVIAETIVRPWAASTGRGRPLTRPI